MRFIILLRVSGLGGMNIITIVEFLKSPGSETPLNSVVHANGLKHNVFFAVRR